MREAGQTGGHVITFIIAPFSAEEKRPMSKVSSCFSFKKSRDNDAVHQHDKYLDSAIQEIKKQ